MAGKLKRVDDDRGSIVLAMLLILIGTMSAALLMPVVFTETGSSAFDARRDHAYDAAQSGLNVMIGRIRAANDGAGNGKATLLPCYTSASPLAGTVSSGANEKFHAWAYYFAQDPQGHPDWLTDSATTQITCRSGSGTAVVPGYAVVLSQGTDSSFTSGTRTVQATYALRSKNTNVPGGLIHAERTTNKSLCLDAGSSSPPIGANVRMQPCSATDDGQQWAFRSNSTLNLTSTADTASGTLGLCLDAPFPHTNGELLTLQRCSSTTTPEQEWTFGGFGDNWHATTTDIRRDTICWNALNPDTAGSLVALGDCTPTPNTFEVGRAYIQDAGVGAGNADGPHGFLVNYNQFGRCASVNWIIGPTPHIDPSDSNYLSFLQSYPCSPVPAGDPGDKPLNQLFTFSLPPTGTAGVTTQIQDTTKINGNAYCVYSLAGLGTYPKTDKCTNPSQPLPSAGKTWTIYGDTGDYTTSYQIRDYQGYCLQATDPNAPDPDVIGEGKISKLIVTTCSSSTLQKWNAPPGILASQVMDYQER